MYTIEMLAEDVVGLLDALELERVHYCGLSLGGMVGIRLASHDQRRLDRLILANTAAQLGPRETWDARIQGVGQGGMAAIVEAAAGRWFTPAFRESSPEVVAAVERVFLGTNPAGYIGCCWAIRAMDQRAALPHIQVPTLVIAGDQDPATPPAVCRQLVEGIARARWAELTAAHLSNIEAADAFTAVVADFLRSKV
jgi:3-oxoadipate enol-lactonase